MTGYDPFSCYWVFHPQLSQLDPVQRIIHTNCVVILPDIFLEKVDKATMTHGIEVRIPLLDSDLVHYGMGLSSSLKVLWEQKKGFSVVPCMGPRQTLF